MSFSNSHAYHAIFGHTTNVYCLVLLLWFPSHKMLGLDSSFFLGGSCYSTFSVAARMPSFNTMHPIIPAHRWVYSFPLAFWGPFCEKSLVVPDLLLIACLILITWQVFSELNVAYDLCLSRSFLTWALHFTGNPHEFPQASRVPCGRFIPEGVWPAAPWLWLLSLCC